MTTNEKIRRNIIWLRREHNLSQGQLATALSITRSLVGSWEEGRSAPQTDHLIALSEYFKISVDELIRIELSKSYVVESVRILAKLTIEK